MKTKRFPMAWVMFVVGLVLLNGTLASRTLSAGPGAVLAACPSPYEWRDCACMCGGELECCCTTCVTTCQGCTLDEPEG